VVKHGLSDPFQQVRPSGPAVEWAVTIEKDREIVTGILHGAANFRNRVYRESIENSFDPLTINLSVKTREVSEANRYHTANP
jgi:hypothetical protein